MHSSASGNSSRRHARKLVINERCGSAAAAMYASTSGEVGLATTVGTFERTAKEWRKEAGVRGSHGDEHDANKHHDEARDGNQGESDNSQNETDNDASPATER